MEQNPVTTNLSTSRLADVPINGYPSSTPSTRTRQPNSILRSGDGFDGKRNPGLRREINLLCYLDYLPVSGELGLLRH